MMSSEIRKATTTGSLKFTIVASMQLLSKSRWRTYFFSKTPYRYLSFTLVRQSAKNLTYVKVPDQNNRTHECEHETNVIL